MLLGSSFLHCATNIKWSHADNPPLKVTPSACSKWPNGATCVPEASSGMQHLQAVSKQEIQDCLCTHLWCFYSVVQLISEHHETILKMTILNSGDAEVAV